MKRKSESEAVKPMVEAMTGWGMTEREASGLPADSRPVSTGQPLGGTTVMEGKKPKLPPFKRNIESETVRIGGVPVKFWRWKRKWYWGVDDKANVRLPTPPAKD